MRAPYAYALSALLAYVYALCKRAALDLSVYYHAGAVLRVIVRSCALLSWFGCEKNGAGRAVSFGVVAGAVRAVQGCSKRTLCSSPIGFCRCVAP
jgi:hypothetical protein